MSGPARDRIALPLVLRAAFRVMFSFVVIILVLPNGAISDLDWTRLYSNFSLPATFHIRDPCSASRYRARLAIAHVSAPLPASFDEHVDFHAPRGVLPTSGPLAPPAAAPAGLHDRSSRAITADPHYWEEIEVVAEWYQMLQEEYDVWKGTGKVPSSCVAPVRCRITISSSTCSWDAKGRRFSDVSISTTYHGVGFFGNLSIPSLNLSRLNLSSLVLGVSLHHTCFEDGRQFLPLVLFFVVFVLCALFVVIWFYMVIAQPPVPRGSPWYRCCKNRALSWIIWYVSIGVTFLGPFLGIHIVCQYFFIDAPPLQTTLLSFTNNMGTFTFGCAALVLCIFHLFVIFCKKKCRGGMSGGTHKVVELLTGGNGRLEHYRVAGCELMAWVILLLFLSISSAVPYFFEFSGLDSLWALSSVVEERIRPVVQMTLILDIQQTVLLALFASVTCMCWQMWRGSSWKPARIQPFEPDEGGEEEPQKGTKVVSRTDSEGEEDTPGNDGLADDEDVTSDKDEDGAQVSEDEPSGEASEKEGEKADSGKRYKEDVIVGTADELDKDRPSGEREKDEDDVKKEEVVVVGPEAADELDKDGPTGEASGEQAHEKEDEPLLTGKEEAEEAEEGQDDDEPDGSEEEGSSPDSKEGVVVDLVFDEEGLERFSPEELDVGDRNFIIAQTTRSRTSFAMHTIWTTVQVLIRCMYVVAWGLLSEMQLLITAQAISWAAGIRILSICSIGLSSSLLLFEVIVLGSLFLEACCLRCRSDDSNEGTATPILLCRSFVVFCLHALFNVVGIFIGLAIWSSFVREIPVLAMIILEYVQIGCIILYSISLPFTHKLFDCFRTCCYGGVTNDIFPVKVADETTPLMFGDQPDSGKTPRTTVSLTLSVNSFE